MVSPVTTRTSASGTPTVVAATWARMVSVPCPCSVTLEITVSLPVGSSRIVGPSREARRGRERGAVLRGDARAAGSVRLSARHREVDEHAEPEPPVHALRAQPVALGADRAVAGQGP